MNILEKIVAAKRQEVASNKELYPVKLLERSIFFETNPLSLRKYLLRPELLGLIAEFKRRSPSKGAIQPFAKPEEVCLGYMQAGAAALSVLTDQEFFGGSNQDLIAARKGNFCPILRKDFIVDPYQIIEAKSIGADAVLLIAAVLEADEIRSLRQLAQSLGLEVLLELHHPSELAKLDEAVDLVGINNRDLQTFQVDVAHSIQWSQALPKHLPKVSESGIDSVETILQLRQAGFQGFLIGEAFMRQPRPEIACRNFVQSLRAALEMQKVEA